MRKILTTIAAAGLLVLPAADGTSGGKSPIELSATPGELEVTAGLPCLPAEQLNLAMTNHDAQDHFADTFFRPDDPLWTSRHMFSSFVPAGQTVSTSFSVRAPYGTEPGDYDFTAELAPEAATATVPVTVVAPPDKAPGENLLRSEQADPSSTYVTSSTEFNPCGAVDGDRTWSAATAWNSAGRGVFPDTYTVTLPEPTLMNRIDLYTAQSAASKPEVHGLRDWDVRLQDAAGEWVTVAEERGNIEWLTSSMFETFEARAVQIVGLAANDNSYTRIAELEAYFDEAVSE